MASVEFRDVSKAYATQRVLKGISLRVEDGEFLTLLGPSGCGKSTLLRLLAGLDVPDTGTISMGDRAVDGLRPKLRDVAMVFQSYALYPHMTVADNMALPLRMRRLSAWQRLPLIGRLLPGTAAANAEIEAEVTRTAAALGIDHLLGRKPGQLSGGQRQRVAVGRALVRHPAVFLMDEPLSNLDAKLRVQMRAEIKELHKRLGITFIYVTHDQAEAMTLSDRVAVMLDGELLQVAPPREIYADPDDRRVAEFIGSPAINMLDGVLRESGLVDVAGTMLATEATDVSAGAALAVGIRPEAFHLVPHGGAGVLSGSVRLVDHMGSDLFVHLEIPGSPRLLIARLPAERAPQVAIGHSLHLAIRSTDVLLFASDGRRIRPRSDEAKVTPIRAHA
jgi:multiple sugar transport system ATP-binding protein